MLFIGTTRDRGVKCCGVRSQRRAPRDATLLARHSACPEVVPKGFLRLDLSFFHLAGPYSCIAGRAETTCFRHRESLVRLARYTSKCNDGLLRDFLDTFVDARTTEGVQSEKLSAYWGGNHAP